MSESYLIPKSDCVIEDTIKHSRFISILFHCDSPETMKTKLIQVQAEYPGANHYCYAFVSGAPDCSLSLGFSDDGEPAGSAGRPMLANLQGSDIGEIGVIVVRYFGGTKLGVGGLVRAYSLGVKQGVSQIQTRVKKVTYPGQLICDYAQLADVEYYLAKYDASIENKQFAAQITLNFAIAKAHKSDLNRDLATLSQGRLLASFSD